MTLSVAISCSDVKFSNAPSSECAAADSCTVDISGETLTKNLIVPYPNNKADILFVVDNSRTMTDEQQRIVDSLSGFLNTISGLDWRIAITTTDNRSGTQDYRDAKLVPFLASNSNGNFTYAADGSNKIYYITKNTSNYSSLFYNTIKRPESYACVTSPSSCPSIVSGDERGIYSAIRNINANSHNFMRSDAQLHVVIISDEDERSNGGGFAGMAIEPGNDRPEDLVNVLKKLNKRTKVHSVVKVGSYNLNNFNFEQCVASQINLQGEEFIGCHYIKASIDTDGIIGNKDTTNYTQILSAIGTDIQDTSISRFSFSCVPTEITVEAVPGRAYPNNLTSPQSLSSNGQTYIDFNPALQPGVEMKIVWKCPRN